MRASLPAVSLVHIYTHLAKIYFFYLFSEDYQFHVTRSLVTTAWRVLRLRMEQTASRYGG
jgi:hypothetical protein